MLPYLLVLSLVIFWIVLEKKSLNRTSFWLPLIILTVFAGLRSYRVGTDNISAEQKQLATAVMEASGLVMWVDNEEHMHAVTAVSGSAPAYMFYFIEAMVDGAVALGLDKEQASALALQTMLGAAKMALGSEDAPSELRRKVTSPNGTTQAAIESMQANDISRQIVEAMQACADRSQALSEEMSK